MKNKLITFYLRILPFYSLLGILFSINRTIFGGELNIYLLIFSLAFDLIIVFSSKKILFRKQLTAIFIFLSFSIIIGLINENTLSRRYITDFLNPFLFFAKIYILSVYWKNNSFNNYVKYYSKMTFIGSLFFLPIVYFLFIANGVSRLAIFPPLELTFSNYLHGNQVYMIITLLAILLYGKRSQLVGAILVYLIYFISKGKRKFGKVFIFIMSIILFFYVIINYKDNYAIKRTLSTVENIFKDDSQVDLNAVSAGRISEIEKVTKDLNLIKFFTGNGIGYSYKLDGDEKKEQSNSHFTPLGIVVKYGIFFCLFIYFFMFKLIFTRFNDRLSFIAKLTTLFVIVQSFFAYVFFVLPILPIVLGYLQYKKENRNRFLIE